MKRFVIAIFALIAIVSCVKEDIVAPVIEIVGDSIISIALGESFADPGATAYDEEDGDLTSRILIASNLDTARLGRYKIEYSVTDNAGNSSLCERYVQISLGSSGIDTIPPVLTIIGPNPLHLARYSSYTEYGATAWDNVSGNITPQIEITGSVNTSMPGFYYFYYSATDGAGNNTTKKRTVVVMQ